MSEKQTLPRPRPPAENEVGVVMERARRSDSTALPELRAAMCEHPEIWQSHGDLAMHARDEWIDLIAGPDLALRESLDRQVEAVRAELAGPVPSPLEALLVDRIVACWLQACYADAAVAQALDISLKQADFARKRQDSAHRRYVTAIGALAMVRRLLGLPAPRSKDRLREPLPGGVAKGGAREADRIEAIPLAVPDQEAGEPGHSR